jgi:hypothetical protein
MRKKKEKGVIEINAIQIIMKDSSVFRYTHIHCPSNWYIYIISLN